MGAADATLVEKSLNGDKAAFGELYDRYAALVRSICYNSTQDYPAAQDLAQEVFLRAWNKLAELKDASRFAPWLISIAKFVSREHRRKLVRDRHVFVGDNLPDVADEPIESATERDEILSWAMTRLEESERLVLQVHYLKGQDADEGSRTLEMSRASYYRLLDRAKKKLASIITKQEKRVPKS